MRHSFFTTCFLLSSLLWTGFTAFAQSPIPEAVKVDLNGRSLPEEDEQASRTWVSLDNTPVPVFPGCQPGGHYIGFQLFYDYADKLTANWTANVHITLKNDGVPMFTTPLEIQMSGQATVNQNVVSTAFYNQAVFCSNPNYWTYTVDSNTPTGSVPNTSVRLRVVLIKAQDDFVPGESITLTPTAHPDRTDVTWGAVTGAVEYDLEWVFIEENEGSFPAPSGTAAFQAKKGGPGVTVAGNKFYHQMAYPDGEIWYRVRPVGYLNANPDHRILGPWHYSEDEVPVSNLTTGLNSDITWKAQTIFAEDGKFKKIVTYYDATMRERQSRVNLSTNSTTIVGEKMYDFEGRSVIQMLPVPTKNVVNQNSLKYSPDFHDFDVPSTVSGQMNPFVGPTRKKFYYDNGRLQNGTVKTTTGAGKYYSSGNEFTNAPGISPLRDYIPNANGYVFSQTEYERDGTSKVLREGNVGEKYTIDGTTRTHAIRHFYSQATTYELTRLFGSNVGDATHYKKKVVVDNNQQVSVAYLDQEGRTIATALAGDPPKGYPAAVNLVDPLPTYPTSITPVNVDISSKNVKDAYSSVTTHKLLNAAQHTTYSFSYTLTTKDAAVQGFDCVACTYDLEISVTDPDGSPVDLPPFGDDEPRYLKTGITTEDDDCQTLTTFNDAAFYLTLPDVGDYTITKTLTPRPLSYDAMKTIVLQDPEVITMMQNVAAEYPLGDTRCENCVAAEECPEANAAIEEAIEEIAQLGCDNIRIEIANRWKAANPNGGEPTDQQLNTFDPATFCTYTLCDKNMKSDAFEKHLTRIPNWVAAELGGYHHTEDLDPFFKGPDQNDGKTPSGYGSLQAMRDALANMEITTTTGPNGPVYTSQSGNILDITDPTNIVFRNLIYYPLIQKQNTMTPGEFNAQMDEMRWVMYRNFYLEEKRKLKMTLSDYGSCTKAMNDLQVIQNLPRTENGIKTYGDNNHLTDNVSVDEINAAIWMITSHCNITLSSGDRQTVVSYLTTYYNGTKYTNPLRLLVKDQQGILDPGLASLKSFLITSFDCDITELAQINPFECTAPWLPAGTNRIQNPTFIPSIPIVCSGSSLEMPCFADWDGQSGTPSAEDGELLLKGRNCGQSASDAVLGLVSPLQVGRTYRLSFRYRMVSGTYNGQQFSGFNTLLIQLGMSQYSQFVPTQHNSECQTNDFSAECCLAPFVESPASFTREGSGTPELFKEANTSPTYVYKEVYFRAVSLNTDRIYLAVIAPTAVSTPSAALVKDLKIELMDKACFPYPEATDFEYTVNWDLAAQQCVDRADDERDELIAYARERLVEGQMSKFYTAYNCLDATTETLTYDYAPKEYHYTLYYYDQAGNLVQTAPPAGVEPDDETFSPQHQQLTTYQYNSYNQVWWQKTPDAGISEFWYDNKSQLRLSHNAQQTLDEKYSYTKYDVIGRAIETGELTSPPLASIPTLVDDINFPLQSAYPLSDRTWTIYDSEADVAGFEQDNVRNRISYTEKTDENKERGDANNIRTYFTYDVHGNVKALLQQIPGLPDKKVNYAYDLVSNKVNYVFFQFGESDQFAHKYSYDPDNRIVSVSTSTDRFSWHLDAFYRYYAHGPLARIELGAQAVQGLDYYYTLQGWIKGMNMPNEGDPGDDGSESSWVGKDAASYTLGYYFQDYSPISGATPREYPDQLWTRMNDQWGHTGLFNGNISWMVTDLAKQGELQSDPAKGMQAMLYRYDQLNRITQSRSLPSFTVGSGFANRNVGTTAHDPYDEDFSYDGNGNLKTLKRLNESAALKDQFQYSYYSNSNKLSGLRPLLATDLTINSGPIATDKNIYRNITIGGTAHVPSGATVELRAWNGMDLDPSFSVPDNAHFSAQMVTGGGTYEYDAIGNLIKDAENGTTITWTPQGKVRQVTKDDDGTTMTFRYDAMGNRVEKKLVKGGTTKITRYLRDASGNVMSVYDDTQVIEYTIYGSSRVGQYIGGGQEGKVILGQRRYEITNHLGNVLSVVNDKVNMNSSVIVATVLSTSDYYPFGSAMEGRTWSDPTLNYRYGFNGKESNASVDWGGSEYDYGFRIYNPEIGRFLSVDPLTKSYPWYTPYQFAGNKPIVAIDLDGLEEVFRINYRENNQITKTTIILVNTNDLAAEARAIWNDLGDGIGAQDGRFHKDNSFWLEGFSDYSKGSYTKGGHQIQPLRGQLTIDVDTYDGKSFYNFTYGKDVTEDDVYSQAVSTMNIGHAYDLAESFSTAGEYMSKAGLGLVVAAAVVPPAEAAAAPIGGALLEAGQGASFIGDGIEIITDLVTGEYGYAAAKGAHILPGLLLGPLLKKTTLSDAKKDVISGGTETLSNEVKDRAYRSQKKPSLNAINKSNQNELENIR